MIEIEMGIRWDAGRRPGVIVSYAVEFWLVP